MKTLSRCLIVIMFVITPTIASCATLKWDAPVCPQDATYRVLSYDADGTRSAPSNSVEVVEDCSQAVGYDVQKSVTGDWSDTVTEDVGNVTTYDTTKGITLGVQ